MIDRELFFGDEDVIFVGAEHIDATGLKADFADALAEHEGLDASWVSGLSRAIALFTDRAERMHRRAPDHWFAPRLANIAIARDVNAVGPHVALLPGANWLLYADDVSVDPSGEFAAGVLMHQERLSHEGRLGATIVSDLVYWSQRTKQERARFVTAAQRSARPDAESARLVGKAFDWIDEMKHMVFAPPPASDGSEYMAIGAIGALIPSHRKAALVALLDDVRRIEADVIDAFDRRHSRGQSTEVSEDLCRRLADKAPPLVITAQDGHILWDPEQPQQTEALTAALGAVSPAVADSLWADWSLVAQRSSQVLDVSGTSEGAGDAFAQLDQEEGGTYIHRDRGMMAYCLAQPGFDPLRQPGPPLHRRLLGARVVHEWGHFVEATGQIHLAEEAEAERAQLVLTVRRIVDRDRPGLRELATMEAAHAGIVPYVPRAFAELLTDSLMERLPDFGANLLVAELATEPERDAYMRLNVRALQRGADGPFNLMMRHAYAYQYLRFTTIEQPFEYFLKVTGVDKQVIDAGVVTMEDFSRLVEQVACLCDHYALAFGA